MVGCLVRTFTNPFFGENHRQALAVHQAAQGPPEVG